jgi:hypothetical protein
MGRFYHRTIAFQAVPTAFLGAFERVVSQHETGLQDIDSALENAGGKSDILDDRRTGYRRAENAGSWRAGE